MPNFLDSLNPEQRQAAEHTKGPLLIIAGAGAGKTKTVTYRILNLIKSGVAPSKILAITFTNKAAKEMKERVEKLLTEDKELNVPISFAEKPFLSTFHSLGVHILKENSKLLGIPRHFAIFDKNDSRSTIKEAVRKAGLDPKQYEPAKFLNIISRQKGNGISVQDYAEMAGSDFMPRLVLKVWKNYEEILAGEKALDFDDLLLRAWKLLKENAEVRAHYQNLWQYIHIDEYQDTNEVQYNLANILAAGHKNICVVGDVDQNIYSWRGAQIKNILDFEKDYPDAKVVLLEQNYRSTQNILTVANKIIAKNKFRKEKNLFTKNPEGEKVGLYQAYDEAEEAKFAANKAKQIIEAGKAGQAGAAPACPAKEIAVLYRANFQSRALEEAFLAEGIPYQVLGTRFFERKEVKDVLCFIRAALNPESISDLKRIINVPPRGIGKVTLLKIVEKKEDSLPAATREKVFQFKKILEEIRNCVSSQKPSETVKFTVKRSGIEDSFRNGTEEDLERLENVRELATLAVKYDDLAPEEGIEKLLSDAALATDQDDMTKETDAVKLMTVHASKGLEFDYVFITGLEEKLFPHTRWDEETEGTEKSEEERRLFYVALTRARKKVYLCYANVRTIFGSRQVNIPSEFIFDIDDEFIEKEESDSSGKPLYKIDF